MKLEIRALIRAEKIENAIDHYEEIREQLQLAKDLRMAAREYLSDPETGELVLIPRSDEIEVVYEDWQDLTPKGNPKKKRDLLSTLLERVAEDGHLEPKRTIAKHVDIRQFALNAINAVDTVLDKIARVEGRYQQNNSANEDIIFKVAGVIREYLTEHPEFDKEEVIRVFAQKARVDVQKVSELVN
ncbi:MAG: hypothetical protein R2747_13560 [Pyrinomonadaceae bacterium]